MLLMALHAMQHVPAVVEACKHAHKKGVYFCPNIPLWHYKSIIGDVLMNGIPPFN
jgi:hypothetical protein